MAARCASSPRMPTPGGRSRAGSRLSWSASAPPATPASRATGGFEERVRATKRKLLSFLIGARQAGRSVAGYGAPGKANTLLNYCGIRTDLLDFTVDRNPYKHGQFTPGTHIPIHPAGATGTGAARRHPDPAVELA